MAMKFGEEWGDGRLSWVGALMVVVFGGVLEWNGKLLAPTLSLRLGWGIGWGFGTIVGVVTNLSKCFPSIV